MIEIVRIDKNVNISIIEELFKIHTNTFLDFDKLSFENFKNEFSLDNRIYYMANLGEKAVGYIGAINCVDFFEIIGIGVETLYQRKGVGTELLKTIFNKAKELNILKIFLEVDEQNLKAQNFYKKNGFLITNIRKNYYKNNDALVMMCSKF